MWLCTQHTDELLWADCKPSPSVKDKEYGWLAKGLLLAQGGVLLENPGLWKADISDKLTVYDFRC